MSYQVASAEEVATLRAQVAELTTRLARVEATRPEWVREEEAQQLTGLSQATLARQRKKPDTLLVFKTQGGLRYERRSLEAFNEARSIRRRPLALAA